MQSIEYRGFKITITSWGVGRFLKYEYTIFYSNDDLFDASPAVYDTEENCLEDAKYVIDKYHDS